MKYDVAMAWVEDLRKNYKKKTNGMLKADDKYCCLGRLCVILGHKFDEDGHVLDKRGKPYKDQHGDEEHLELPKSIMKKAGMKSSVGDFPEKLLPKKLIEEGLCEANLAAINDEGGKGFKWIASFIEKNWKYL